MAIIDEFKELYKDLFEYSSDYLLLIELNGRIIEVNKFLLQNPDISASKILNTKIYEFTFQKEDIQEFDENKQFIWYKNSTEPLIIKLVKKNGTPLFIKVDKIPLKKNNQTIAFLGIGHDISKQIEMDNIIHEYSKHNNELKESEEIFRSIFKKSPYYLSVWRKVKVGFILFDYNNVAKKFSRFNLKELKGRSITEFPDNITNRRIYIENVNRCFKEKSTFIEETELYVKALKTKRNFQVIYKYISPDLVLCHIEDFTRRVRTELKLKESEEKFRSLFKGTPHFTLAWKKENDDFILLDFNNNMEKITKGRISGRIGHTFSQIYFKEQKTPGLLENLINCFEEKRNYSIETRMYLEFFKRERDFLITYSYIPPKYVITHVEDITRRKREEQKLKESEEKYRTIIENAKEGYYEVDLKGNYTLVNNAYCKLFGYLREELIGKNYQNFTTKETINMTFKTFNKVYNTGIEQTSFEYVVINKNGNIKYGDTSIHLIHDLEGNKIGFRGFIKETTEKKLAEEKLKESEEKFRLISETSNDLIRIVNNEYRIEYINENTHLKLLGYSNEDLIGKHLIKILHPDELDQNLAFANKVREIGEAREELRSKHKDGHWIWFDVFAKEFFDKYGNSHGLIVSRDIRERKLAELKLKESEAKFRKLFKGTPNFTIAWQKEKDDFILIDYNDGAIEISNGGIRERVGQTASQMYIKELNRPDLVENLNVCFENKRNHTKEIRRYIDFLDTERDLRIKYTYIPPNLVLSQWEDITQRKKAEQQLKESEEKFRLITENSNDLIRIGNIDYKIEYLNENTHLKLLGYSKEDLIGKSLEKILHPDEEKKILNFAKRRLENGEAIEELRLRHKDRHWVWFDIFAKDFFDKYGNKKTLAISRDITERKLAELKLKASEQNYRNAYERENFYKDLFMHDMSNILQGMLSSLDLCKYMLKNDNQIVNISNMLDTLGEQIQRGSNLVKNVRKFSELQDSEIILKNFNIKDLINQAINIVKKSSPSKTINVQIESFSNNLTIKSDEFLLDVFENIIFNAVKHNKNSIVEILIKFSDIQEDKKMFLKIEFIDNGYGVVDSRKHNIFKRGGYNEDKSVSGIGLGLSLVYNILNRYSAKIWVENRDLEDYTKGSNFIIQFPLL